MTQKLAVVAIGGNSLILDPKNPDVPHQWNAVRETCQHIAQMIAEGWNVVVTHGNGPQVGYILRRGGFVSRGGDTVPPGLIFGGKQGAVCGMLQPGIGNKPP